MDEQRQLTEEQRRKQRDMTDRSRWVFSVFLISMAALGLLFVIIPFLKPHQTGVVTYVRRITQQTGHTGTGIHRTTYKRFASNVRVQVKGTSEKETVHYRVKNRDMIPAVGDEIEFSHSLLVGCEPYPAWWAIWTGVFLLGLVGVALLGYLIAHHRKARDENPWQSEG